MSFLKYALFFFLSIAPLLAASSDELFARGNVAFADERFEEAVIAYSQILTTMESPNLHYNLGTAYAKLKNYPAAAFHFLEALRLNPNHTGAQANLRLISKNLEIDSPLPHLPGPANLFSLATWIVLLAISAWAVLFLLLFLFHPAVSLPGNKFLLFLALSAFAFSAVSTFLALDFQKWTIVAKPDSVLRLAPTADSPGHAYLNAGAPVKRLESRNGFLLVQTTDDKQGFIAFDECFPLNSPSF